MFSGRMESIAVLVPSGGQTDPYTAEALSGSTTTETGVSVIWVSSPKKELQFDRESGRVLGHVKVADAQILYQSQGHPDDADWNTWIRPGVIVRRGNLEYQPISIAEWPHRGWQVVGLKLREGGQSAGA